VIQFLLLLAALMAACAPVDEAAPEPVVHAQVPNEMTDGWVSMRPDRRLSIVYDREPETVLTSFPGHAGYSNYLELAGGLEPGQRKRIARPGPTYVVDNHGNYAVRSWAIVSAGYGEPSSRWIGSSDPQYSCYDNVLRPRGIGGHIMTLADWRSIEACIDAQTDQ
jgi:hypothetical protein